ncbi:hypothetical protein MJO28_008662 [Puccinia striiformis f. sp. tritici]|uniref:Uncharacterized protein n=2 Tax=Puccinia striiformis f. sp. tritici TaxID=168172 RepID=A0ACC0ECU9_9BASI|nr:hypothetical protein MJO28_008658 [Puccinia striiformis f. sp. tritici]KAI7949841.1 hypothetical protein MJO28_008662 [Puccinia striiformis f. sp. tritici]
MDDVRWSSEIKGNNNSGIINRSVHSTPFHTVDALRGKIEDFDLLEKTPFNYGLFEKKATGYHKTIPQVLPSPIATNQTVKNTTGIGHLNQEDFFWRIRSYLDAQGRCHYCKKSCGNAPGTCPGPLDRRPVDVPSSFVTPPKPVNYVRPQPRSDSQPVAGKAVHPPAGRPSNRSSSLAALEERDEQNDAYLQSAVDEYWVECIHEAAHIPRGTNTDNSLVDSSGPDSGTPSGCKLDFGFGPTYNPAALASMEETYRQLMKDGHGGFEDSADGGPYFTQANPSQNQLT